MTNARAGATGANSSLKGHMESVTRIYCARDCEPEEQVMTLHDPVRG